MTYKDLILEKDGYIGVVTLNRPDKLNALGRNLRAEMTQVSQELMEDDEIRVVIWTGAGRGFSSGVDLTDRQTQPEVPPQQERLDELGWTGRQAINIYRSLTKPTIAAVNGVAAGAGMSLSLACDLRIGCENTRFKTVFIERSLSPDSGMSYFLPRIVGVSRAFDLVFTSRDVYSDEAHRIGLLDRVTTADKLMEDAKALANQIAFWPPIAMQSAKRVLQHSMETYLEEQLKYESFGLQFARRAPHDVEEAGASFREKRSPKFTGR